ncbi:hypothetical protein M3Y95_00037900 [Aphelenchoides besseyi]|nr:hypothetical protein M3Y95_00037900 [Aphelenchoides besseyi]
MNPKWRFFFFRPFVLLTAIWSTRLSAISSSDFCRFEESLKQKFRNLECNSDLDECATKARQMAQENLSGTWGAVIVGNKDLVVEKRVDWHVHSINPQPSRCRLLVNDTVVLEVFRTGYRKLSANQDQRHYVWRKARTSSVVEIDICPHSALRELMAAYSLKKNGKSDSSSEASSRSYVKSMIYTTAQNLAQLFYAETGHRWNVFVTKDVNRKEDEFGLNLPHYVFDARAGFCIGQTPDGYSVNAAVIGFADEHEEATSNG